MSNTTLSLKDIKKTFLQGREHLEVLKGVDLDLKGGEIVALLGSSGSGKSTLLQIAGLLDRPSGGQIIFEKETEENGDIWQLSDQKRTRFRRENIGFVYQFHHLLPEFTALENVMMPLILQGKSFKEAAQKATDFLSMVKLKDRASHRPSKLSGGEQQRVAILRALIGAPRILLADEPTGNLDNETSQIVFEELIALVRKHNIAALIATHDLDLAKRMDRIVHLENGLVS